MDLMTRMSLGLAYVEENLTGEINPEKLARIAGCSAYNYYRMFSFITDMSLTEYIRRRKMTLAAIDLRNSLKVWLRFSGFLFPRGPGAAQGYTNRSAR